MNAVTRAASRFLPHDDRTWGALVTPAKGKTGRRLIIIDAAYWLLGFACVNLSSYESLEFICVMVLGILLAGCSLGRYRRAMAYRAGWFDGRQAMSLSLYEAMHRGMSLNDWHTAEVERTLHTITGGRVGVVTETDDDDG